MSNFTKLHVTDTNCPKNGTPRTHEIIVDGEVVSYTFKFGEKKELPFAHAVKFLVDKAFKVADKEGKLFNSPASINRESETKFTLRPGQVVANLEELSFDALLIRANQISGGERHTKRSGKAKLVEFLTSARPKPVAKATDDEEEAEPVLAMVDDNDNLLDDDEVSEGEMDKMLTIDAPQQTV